MDLAISTVLESGTGHSVELKSWDSKVTVTLTYVANRYDVDGSRSMLMCLLSGKRYSKSHSGRTGRFKVKDMGELHYLINPLPLTP